MSCMLPPWEAGPLRSWGGASAELRGWGYRTEASGMRSDSCGKAESLAPLLWVFQAFAGRFVSAKGLYHSLR